MKFEIEKSKINDILNKITNFIDIKSTNYINTTIKLEFNNKNLTLKAINDTNAISATIENINIDSDEDINLAIDATILNNIVKKAPKNSIIKFNFKEDKGTITYNKSRFIISYVDAKDYPAVNFDQDKVDILLKSSTFNRLIKKTKSAICLDEGRHFLTGLFLHIKDNKLIAVATDGHRLSESFCNYEHYDFNGIIIPRKTINQLKDILDSDDLNIKISNNKILFKCNNYTIISKVIDGQFPKYQNIIPKDNNKIFSIEKDVLVNSIDRALIMSNDKQNSLAMEISSNKLIIKSSSVNGDSSEELDINYLGEDLVIGFNARFLLESIAIYESDLVTLRFGTSNNPLVIKEENQTSIIMPIKI